MEKWRNKGRCTLKADVDFPKNHSRNAARPSSPVEKKKGRKWSFGNFLKRKTKDVPAKNVETSTQTSIEAVDNAIYAYPPIPQGTQRLEIINIHKKPQNALSNCSQDSITSPDINSPRNHEETVGNSLKNSKKNRSKLRIQAKREKYKGNSSSEDEFPSNLSLLRIHSEDSIQSCPKYDSFNQKRTRGARTERYMKRLFTSGDNKFLQDQCSIKHQLKCPSDILPPMGSPISDYRPHGHAHRKSYSCTNSYSPVMTQFGSDCHIPNNRSRLTDSSVLQDNHVYSNQRYPPHHDPASLYPTNYHEDCVQPPEPPPRSFKLRLFPSTMRYSLQHSDIENTQNEIIIKPYNDFNCNSLGRIHRSTKNDTNRSASPQKNVSWARKIEDPIIPQFQKRTSISKTENIDVKSISEESDRKRHSKNLEEALEELETIYNSLRLSDEDLLDRAEQRSMDEYREKLATIAIEGSIKSTSNTSSSTDMTRELSWRDNYENDPRLKDDMAYRRMHHERSSSVDNNGSISQMSYLASSPCLSYKDMSQIGLNETPKSHRISPDLTRDDVLFRSINHANNTLKIVDPQPPFGIPVGPVSGAAESDYLHVVPHKDESSRSLYIPKREPDVVTDDLAFRSLRKDGRDRSQSPGNMSFLPKTFVPEVRRSVRSLSADLYGIINKDSKQSSWYKEYVKLNRPLRVSGILESSVNGLRSESVDINGNRPKKINYKGKVQVFIPQEFDKERIEENNWRNERRSVELEIVDNKFCSGFSSPTKDICGTSDKAILSFTDEEVSEYKELCRELENLIKKTSERVKIRDKEDSSRSSLTEFVEWEELFRKDKATNEVEASESQHDDKRMEDDERETIDSLDIQRNEINIDRENKDENVDKDLSDEPVPYVCTSQTTEQSSSVQNLKDGSSDNETTIDVDIKIENREYSNEIEQPSDDKILITSNDNKLNNDCHQEVNITSMIEGETIGNKCNGNVELNGDLLKSIMNFCFVTNCLTAYSIALWSLCLTLLIAIIVAL